MTVDTARELYKQSNKVDLVFEQIDDIISEAARNGQIYCDINIKFKSAYTAIKDYYVNQGFKVRTIHFPFYRYHVRIRWYD